MLNALSGGKGKVHHIEQDQKRDRLGGQQREKGDTEKPERSVLEHTGDEGKAFELEEAIDYMSPDVLFLQEIFEKEELKLCGFKISTKEPRTGQESKGWASQCTKTFLSQSLGENRPTSVWEMSKAAA
ncbi:MAG: uncharacterized protein A8A55_1850 [Amphiamblys sp. WSBS2006]|nr:MAG: uncharacterized protein A8A55_1850 [Amphiamblys sp. WSBS2006]